MTTLAKPFMLMVAGPNGSGKTTLTNHMQAEGVAFGHYINADDIAKGIDEDSDVLRAKKAQDKAEEQRQSCILRRENFSFETVMSHQSKIELIKQAKTGGFHTEMYFVGTNNPLINEDRVSYRVSQGGHSVPKEKIAARWTRTMGLLAQAIALADISYVFDNSSHLFTPEPLYFIKGVNQFDPKAQYMPWIKTYVIDPLTASDHIVDFLNNFHESPSGKS